MALTTTPNELLILYLNGKLPVGPPTSAAQFYVGNHNATTAGIGCHALVALA